MGSIIKDSACTHKPSWSPLSLDSRFITPPIKKSKFCFPFILIKQQEFPGRSADKANCSQLEKVGLVPVMRILTLSLLISLLTLQIGVGLQGWVTEILRFSEQDLLILWQDYELLIWIRWYTEKVNIRGPCFKRECRYGSMTFFGGGRWLIKWVSWAAEEQSFFLVFYEILL